MKRFCKSLLAKYMSIILTALCLMFLLQIGHAFLGAALFKPGQEAALDRVKIEAAWLREAEQLQNPSPGQTQQHFQRWKQQYPKASMFWVDGEGLLAAQLNVEEQLPIRWTPAVTAQFMKRHTEGTAFTFVAFVGGDETQGFLVLDLPRIAFEPPLQILYQSYGPLLVLGVAVVVVLFIVISFLFFQSIRKRLVQLQEAMTMRDADRIPLPIDIQKQDEIGQLEQAFNEMVCQLRESKQREQAEEQLRKELIANLSHDLRTPLTKISAQVYSLAKGAAPETERAVRVLEASLADIADLMENLMSYTLLMSSRYKLERKEVDVVRYTRERLASWYSVFEREGFEIEAELLPLAQPVWLVDPLWIGRILDNLLQNVLRHARSGRYVKVGTIAAAEYDALVVEDRGRGMGQHSGSKGAGIGLSIVNMMTKGLELDWHIDSKETGTTIQIRRYRKAASFHAASDCGGRSPSTEEE